MLRQSEADRMIQRMNVARGKIRGMENRMDEMRLHETQGILGFARSFASLGTGLTTRFIVWRFRLQGPQFESRKRQDRLPVGFTPRTASKGVSTLGFATALQNYAAAL